VEDVVLISSDDEAETKRNRPLQLALMSTVSPISSNSMMSALNGESNAASMSAEEGTPVFF
jgi:hypothetical protein